MSSYGSSYGQNQKCPSGHLILGQLPAVFRFSHNRSENEHKFYFLHKLLWAQCRIKPQSWLARNTPIPPLLLMVIIKISDPSLHHSTSTSTPPLGPGLFSKGGTAPCRKLLQGLTDWRLQEIEREIKVNGSFTWVLIILPQGPSHHLLISMAQSHRKDPVWFLTWEMLPAWLLTMLAGL